MDIIVSPFAPPERGPVELVERKGVGHPDSLCDAVADLFARRLAQLYPDETGRVFHHNVDKALLCAGAAAPTFGGGRGHKIGRAAPGRRRPSSGPIQRPSPRPSSVSSAPRASSEG